MVGESVVWKVSGFENQWRGESVVGKSVMWNVSGGRVSGAESQWWKSQ